jgi:hypothetical protein
MPDQPKPRPPPDSFASFAASAAGLGRSRRKARWSLNPTRDGTRAGAEAARLSNLEGEIMRGLGKRQAKE